MKLTINKDYDCTKCGKYICCSMKTSNEKNHNFCFHCGEPIEWIKERTAEEVLEELMIETRILGGRDIRDDIKETLEIEKRVDSLKQELLNKINK